MTVVAKVTKTNVGSRKFEILNLNGKTTQERNIKNCK